MNIRNLTVADAMTKAPHGIAPDESVAKAKERMRKLKVRHLPVRTGGRVIGILSERDIDLISSLPDVDIAKTQVSAVMTSDPYTVTPLTPLARVTSEMAERRIGSALVVDEQNQLLGIFTDTDSLSFLSHLLGKTSSTRIPTSA